MIEAVDDWHADARCHGNVVGGEYSPLEEGAVTGVFSSGVLVKERFLELMGPFALLAAALVMEHPGIPTLID